MSKEKDIQSMAVLLKRLFQHISRQRRTQAILLFVLMVVASLAEVLSIGAVLPFLGVLTAPEKVFAHRFAQPFVHALDLSSPHQLLLPLTVAFALAAVFSGAMRLILLWAQTRLSHAIGADLSISIYRRTLYQPYAVHVARNSSEVISGIAGKANGVVHSTLMPLLTMATSFLLLTAILLALLAVDTTVALSAFAGFGSIYVAVTLITKSRLLQNGRLIGREEIQVIKALQEGLGGIRDVLIDGTQSVYCQIYADADVQLRRAQASNQIIGASPRYGIEALGMVLIAILAYTLANRSESISAAIPILGALALGAQRLLPVLQQAYAGWASIRSGQASLRDALEMLDQPLPSYAALPPPKPLAFEREIKFEKIGFRYASNSAKILDSLDLVIPRGARVGFVGTTGSGKSTLLDICMGLLSPTQGCIRVDGISILAHNTPAWQTHVSHVPQAIFLSDATLAENIAFGVPLEKIDQKRVEAAAQQAQISADINSWPDKYATLVGERGVRLSGGQRQRIGIARALYKQADVLVLDEATSALDSETESAVIEAIEGLGHDLTILMVAHRLTTLRGCTQIIELVDGRIARVGSYDEIMGNGVLPRGN